MALIRCINVDLPAPEGAEITNNTGLIKGSSSDRTDLLRDDRTFWKKAFEYSKVSCEEKTAIARS